jgi:hypothetical protein
MNELRDRVRRDKQTLVRFVLLHDNQHLDYTALIGKVINELWNKEGGSHDLFESISPEFA